MPYTPTTRKPTGAPAAPLIMVSGTPKAGKSTVAYRLSGSPRIDRTFVLDLGEGSADEYADLGPYEIVEWGGSWSTLAESVDWCVRQVPEAGKLNVVILDSGTEIWEGLKDRAAKRARSSQRARKILESDPDAEIDVTMTYWNDAANAWARIINPLRLSPTTIGVVLVRADEVAEIGANGQPIPGRKTVSYQAHKSLTGTVTAHVEVRREGHQAFLVDVRSSRVQIPRGGLRLDDANPLADLIGRMAGDATFTAPVVRTPVDTERPRIEDEDHSEPTVDEVEAGRLYNEIRDVPDQSRKHFTARLDERFGKDRRQVKVSELLDPTWRAQVRACFDEWAHEPADTTADEPEISDGPTVADRLRALAPEALRAVVTAAEEAGISNTHRVPASKRDVMHAVMDRVVGEGEIADGEAVDVQD